MEKKKIALARQMRDIFKRTKGVVDVDWYVEDDQTKYRLLVDKEKAALNGSSEDDVSALNAGGLRWISSGAPASGRREGRYFFDRPIGPCDTV